MRTPPQGRASAPVHFYVFTLTTRKCNHRMNKTTHHYTEAGPRRGRHSGATRLLTRLSACAGMTLQSDVEKHHDQTKNHPDHEGNTGMTLHTKARRAALALALAAGMIPGLASAAPVSCEHWNTLAFFIRAGAADVARCLKTKDANARDAAGLTPMHRAAGFGRTPALVRTLAKAGAQPNARDVNGMTPLHLAVNFNRNPAVVTALIAAGAEIETREQRGWTPLHLAAAFGKTPAVVRALTKAGAKVDAQTGIGRTALHLAAQGGAPATVAALIKAGAKVNARDIFGRAPLHLAAQGDSPAAVRALVKAGAKINARDKRGAWTPLHLAAWFGKSPAVVRALIRAGANPRAKDKSGKTPLDYAKQNPAFKGNLSHFKRRK